MRPYLKECGEQEHQGLEVVLRNDTRTFTKKYIIHTWIVQRERERGTNGGGEGERQTGRQGGGDSNQD